MIDFDFNMEIDTDEYDNENDIIEKGRHNFVVEDVENAVTKNGNKQIKFRFKVTSQKFKNYCVFYSLVFATKEQSEYNLKKVALIIKACQFKNLKLNELENLIGREFSADVFHKFNDYNGRNEPQVRLFEIKDYVKPAISEDKKNGTQRKAPAEPTLVDKNTPSPISKKTNIKKDDDDDELFFK